MFQINRSGFKPRKTMCALAVSTVIALSSTSVFATDGKASIHGHITSITGSDLNNATITIKHEGKGIVRTTSTTEKGDFKLKGLPIGNYTISVTKDGFGTVNEQHVTVNVSGLVFDAVMANENDVERIEITGARISQVDTSSTQASQVISTERLNLLPVELNSSAVALLAPGTVGGDNEFGGVAIGGSSVAENGYMLNGLNITDVRKGMGDIALPWQAIQQTEVITGGVSPEYGRFIGGVVNLVSKSGDNDWSFGAKVEIEPQSLREPSPWVNNQGKTITAETSEYDEREVNLWASGAIIEDTLFFYGLYNPQKGDGASESDDGLYETEWKRDMWFAKLDWEINENHSLSAMAFDNSASGFSNEWRKNDEGNADVSEEPGQSKWKNGGLVWNVQYTGYLTDDFTMSAMYGRVEDITGVPSGTPDQSTYWDSRNGFWEPLGDWVGYSDTSTKDIRKVYRLDFDYVVGDHTIRFGYDHETLDISDYSDPHGDGWYEYYRAEEDGAAGLPILAGEDYADLRIWGKASETTNKSNAIYVTDTWQITDQFVLNLGIRASEFSNTTGSGEKYVDLKDQIAPRLGFTYDFIGDGSSKLYGSYGRYFQPVSPNTNVRMASAAYDIHHISRLESVNEDGSPVLGDALRTDIVADGTVPDADQLFNNQAESMYSDEIIIGYEQQINEDWAAGIRLVSRELKQSIEDISFNYGMNQWIKENYADDPNVNDYLVGGWFPTLTNPGRDVTMDYDVDGDGIKESVTVTSDMLGFPESKRQYYAAEFNVSGYVSKDFFVAGSYTWSHSYGNTEGLVRSDNGQADPGWTTSFDYPELMDNGYGNLPNDRRHNFKAYGIYTISEDFSVGFNVWAKSGKPKSAFGVHPEDEGYCVTAIAIDGVCYGRDWYGAASFYNDGVATPRGSLGTTEWVYNLDLNLTYRIDFDDAGILTFKANIFNVFNSNGIEGVDEQSEYDSGANNPRFGFADDFQTPRYMKLSMRYDF
ncbi:carboxypeptidase regulatory-like domain-containing protein [Colwelliaceae bacterium 6441]